MAIDDLGGSVIIGIGISPCFGGSVSSGLSIPAWVLASGATPSQLDIDFVNDRAWLSPDEVSIATLLACSRASSGYYTKADGTLQNFTSNTLRYGTNGLLQELTATNMLLRSQEFGNVSWSPVASSVTSDSTAAPDGSTTADTVTVTSNVNNGLFPTAPATGSAANYTFSLYVKSGSSSWVTAELWTGSGQNGVRAWFNLSAGAKGTANATAGFTYVNHTIETLANGWFRITVTGTWTVSDLYVISRNVDGDGAFNFTAVSGRSNFLWGAQLELGSAASSYVPTTSSSAARATDLITFSDLTWLDGANDTLYAEWTAKNVNNATIWALDATADKLLIETTGMRASIAGATVGNNISAGAIAKAAARLKLNDFAISANGGTAAADTSESAPGTLAAARLGLDLAGANALNGYIRRIAAFKGLSANDAALVTLST